MKALIPPKRKREIASGTPGAGFRQREKGQDVEPAEVGKPSTKPTDKLGLSQEEKNKRLVEGAKDGDLACVKLMITEGAEINGESETLKGSKALWEAVEHGTIQHIEVVEYLVEQGADVNTRNLVGSGSGFVFDTTVLKRAEDLGHDEIARILRAHGGISEEKFC